MSLYGRYDDDNIFAKILRGEMPCVKVYEDENTFSFMDVFPQSKGHLLIIHKTAKARNLLEIGQDDLCSLAKTTQKLTKAVNSALNPDGIVITQFNGAAAGQTVFHLHFHIIPRYQDEKMSRHASGKMADMEALQIIAEKIKSSL